MTISIRALTLAALLASAAIPAGAETPDDQLVVGFSMTNILTLDPGRDHRAGDRPGSRERLRRARLARCRPNRDRQSRARRELEVAPDNKSITFKLRDGATFASGNPVTSEDVVWSLKR